MFLLDLTQINQVFLITNFKCLTFPDETDLKECAAGTYLVQLMRERERGGGE